MWTYVQRDGHLLTPAGALLAVGYSGRGPGLNNPAMQSVPREGPIPQGLWSIMPPADDPRCGPYTLGLVPHDGTDTFGRTAFRIHGDLIGHVGQDLASEGCIVLAPGARQIIWESDDHILKVVSGEESSNA